MKTTMKLTLAVLLIILFSGSIYAECSKNEVMKLVDKGFSKTEINSICGIAQKADKWITPTDITCKANGGRIIPDGVCSANFQDAKAICSASDGRLPTINELEKVIKYCGGDIGKAGANYANDNYQACCRRKGFTPDAMYHYVSYQGWSNGMVPVVNFRNGLSKWSKMTSNNEILCVSTRQ